MPRNPATLRIKAATVTAMRYPCTGQVSPRGFGAFVERELGEARHNLMAFAAELGAAFGAEEICLVNSGSSANLAAALAVRERTGAGHAITSGFTFPTTMSAMLAAGFDVTAVDTERDGFCVDPEAVRRALRPDTRLICVTHFLGFPAQIDTLAAIATEAGAVLLQDACETLDLRVGGRRAHQRGLLTTWSFYHPHHLSSYGGGAVVCADPEWRAQVESIVHWGRACRCHYDPAGCPAPPGMGHQFHYVRAGHNLELSELNACFGRFQMATWLEQETRRRQHYTLLHSALVDHPRLAVSDAPADSGSPFVFPITVRDGQAAALAERLAARGVEVRTLMGGTITHQPAYRSIPSDGLTHCLRTAESSFFVGVHQTIPTADVAAVAGIIGEEASR